MELFINTEINPKIANNGFFVQIINKAEIAKRIIVFYANVNNLKYKPQDYF